jgi:toxin-antitoxin system PIN domain toxin
VFAVDTNVLVYAADEAAAEHPRCRQLVDTWRPQALPWYTTWSVIYEFLRVTTHPRVFRRPWTATEAWHFVESLLASPGLGILVETSRHVEIAAITLAEIPGLRGNLFHDAHTAVLMREHGIRRIYTRDQDFHRFPFVEVIDPLTES